ncbi:N-acetylmuramoyl-L-alanine amidase [Mariniluteicoccus flavus]
MPLPHVPLPRRPLPQRLRRALPAAGLALAVTLGSAAPAYAAPTPTPSATTSTAIVAKPGIVELSVPSATRTTVDGRELVASLGPRTTAPFSMAGVTWAPGTAAPTAPIVQVRTRTGTTWSTWSTLATEAKATDDARARPGTSPTFTGEATGVEVRVLVAPGTSAPTDLKLSLIDPGRLASDAAPTATRPQAETRAAGSTQAPMPSIISRAAWGADENLKAKSGADCMAPKYDETVKAVVVHHTEGSNTYTPEQSAGIVRGIYAYHVTGNGWCDIGYNFLIDRYGKIFEGRFGGVTKPVHGAHAYDWNTNTMGLSIMGNFMGEVPPEAALNAATRLTAWRLAAYYREPVGRLTIGRYTSDVISGHRQVGQTDCPGDAFFAYLPTFRQRVAALMGSYQTPIWKRWQELGGAAGAAGQPYVGEAAYAGGRVTRFAKMDIYQTPDGRVQAVTGPIRTKYAALGDALGPLGFPGADQNCSDTGCWQLFPGGVIISSPSTGAHANWGAIRDKYAEFGFEHGALGYPTTDEVCGATGCYQGFQGGFILFSGATGAHVSRGAIRDKYATQDVEHGWLGYPTTDEKCDAAGCWQDYQGGSIVFSLERGTHFTRGAIRLSYLALGGQHGFLGHPSSDEICGLRDRGCVQLFGHEAIFFSPASGTFENRGAIRDAYAAQGFETGRLGYPTTGERCDTVRCVQRFQGGTITFTWGGGTTVS